MLDLGIDKLKEHIKTIGLYNNKAKNIIECSKMLCEKFNGEVPNNFNSLVSLPGVGRKTANVVRAVGFNIKQFNFKKDLIELNISEEEADKAEDAKVDAQLMDKLVEMMEADIPEVMFTNEVENMMRDYETRLRYQGLDMEMFMKYTGQTIDTLKTQFRPQAEKQVKTRLALEAVAAAEAFEATAEEIDAEYTKIAEAYGVKVEDVRAQIDDAAIAADLVVGKAAELIRDTAVVSAK